jgi:hypothetical protein
MNTVSPLRAAGPRTQPAPTLDLPAELPGALCARGFNLIALPSKQNKADFRLVLIDWPQITVAPLIRT